MTPDRAKELTRAEINAHPPGSYIYFLYLADECVYIGSTRNLKNRLPMHRAYNGPFDAVRCLSVPVGDRLYYERKWKFELKPRYNTDCHKSVVDVAENDLPTEFLSIDPADIPPVSCVYFLAATGRAFYVGKAKNVRSRLCAHRSQGKVFDRVYFWPCPPSDLLRIEKEMRSKFGPAVEGNTFLDNATKRRKAAYSLKSVAQDAPGIARTTPNDL